MKTLAKMLDLRKLAKAMKQVFAVMVALSFISQQALAATYTVTSNLAGAVAGRLETELGVNANADGDIVTFATTIGNIAAGADITLLKAVSVKPGDAAVTIANNIITAAAKGLTMDLANTLNANSSDATLSGVISGAGGTLTIKNTGGTATRSLTLSGLNSYGGGTTIDGTGAVIVSYANAAAFGAGAVTVNGGNNAVVKAGAAVNPANNFTLAKSLTIDGNNVATTFSGIFSGAGGLTIKKTVDDANAVTLSGVNTFTGGLTIGGANSAGVLNVTAALNGAGAGNLTMTGFSAAKLATLTLTGAQANIKQLTGDANSRIANGGNLLTVNPSGGNSTWAGVISGAGGLTVNDTVGGGKLTLTGANTYTGNTTVTAGTLALGLANAAGAAAGSLTTAAGGTFDMAGFAQTMANATNNGTIKTGAGVLTLTGAYNAGAGTLEVTPTAGVTNLAVTGAATLTNQTLAVSGSPANGTYRVVNAGGGLGGTQFATITMQRGFLLASSAYGANTLDITTDAGFAVAEAVDANQSSLLPALNTTLDSDITLAASLGALSMNSLTEAFNKITPVGTVAMGGLGAAGASLQAGAVGQRMAGLAQGMSNPDGDRVAIVGVPGPLLAEPLGDTGAAGSSYDSSSPWGVFVSGLHNTGKLDTHVSAIGTQPGYKFYASGASAGIDYRLGDHFALGVSGGYTSGQASLLDHYGTVGNESLRYGIYGVGYLNAFHADVYVGGAKDYFDIRRNVVFGRVATASPQGTEFNLDTRLAYDWDLSPAVVSPYAGLAYDRMSIGSYSETGAGSLNLSVNKQTSKSLRSTLGTKIAFELKAGAVVWRPYVNIGWQRENAGQDRSIDAQFITGGGAFSVKTADESRNALLAGVGMGVDLKKAASVRVGYTANRREGFDGNSFEGSLRFRF